MKNRASLIIPAALLLLVLVVWVGRPGDSGSTAVSATAPAVAAGGAVDWSDRWREAGNEPAARAAVLEEAARERDGFLDLMRSDPQQALAKAMGVAAHESLPAALKEYFPRPFSGRGELDQEWEVSIVEGGGRACSMTSVLRMDGGRFEVHVAGGGRVPVLRDAPVAGIRLGSEVVLAELPVVALGPADWELLSGGREPGNDPVTGNPGNPAHAAWVAGQPVCFESAAGLDGVARELAAAVETAASGRKGAIDEPFEWLAGDKGGDLGGNQETPYQQNQIDVLFIRVDFSDFPGAPVTQAALQTTLASVNTHLANFSYGQAGITYTVSGSVYRMPRTGASYAVAGDNDDIQTDARALASANFNLANYDVIGVYFPNLSSVPGSLITYGGLASIGGSSHWVNGFNSVGIIAHEFGHNYGMYHANYHHPEQVLGGTYELPGVLEYGDIFDLMGDGDAPEAHFSHLAKNQMQWMADSKVVEATGDGDFVIHRFDHPNATSNPTLAVKVPMAGDANYWIGYRQLYTSASYNLLTGAYVVAENLADGRETCLIDMTPESKVSESDDRRDAGLPVGSSFYDPAAGVTITSLARGGAEPNQWIQVRVEFDPRIRVAQTAVEVDEQRGVARVRVERLFGFTGAVSVDYATVAGTAAAGTDYLAVSGTLHWGDGDSTPREITVPVKPDATVENRETLTVQLSNVVGGVLDGEADATVITLLEPGQRFASFAPPFFSLAVNAVAPVAGGKVVVGGTISEIGGVALGNIARLNPDGSLDTGFVTGTGFNGLVKVIRVQDDGKLLVGGEFTTYNGAPCKQIARLNANGTLDGAFTTANGTGPNGSRVNDIRIESGGKILVGGNFSSFNGVNGEGLVRLTSSGSRDAVNPLTLPFETLWDSEIHALLVEPGGKIMAGGSFYINGAGPNLFRFGIARLNATGTRDGTFDPVAGVHTLGNTNQAGLVYAIDRTHDGKYVIGGFFSAYNTTARSNIARVLSTGAIDLTFTPPAVNNPVYALRMQPGGKVVVGGTFSSPTSRLLRLNTNGSQDAGFAPAGGPSFSVYALGDAADGGLWVGGNYFQYEGTTSRPIVKVASGVSPYAGWQETHFTAAEILANLANKTQDPDLDGRSNLEEYAFGTNPRTAQTGEALVVGEEDTGVVQIGGQRYLQISIDKGAQAEGVWYAAQFGTQLATWLPATPGPQTNAVYEVVQDSATRYTVRDKTPVSGQQKRFGRIHLLLAE